MRVAVFSTQPYDREFLEAANEQLAESTPGAQHELGFFEARLTAESAPLAAGVPAVCVFVNDDVNADVVRMLGDGGTRLIALRCAGFNNVDIGLARRMQISVVRVPAYSPYAVAEHTIGLILALDRQVHRAHARVREGNFALNGLLGFDLHGKTVGVVGTGADRRNRGPHSERLRLPRAAERRMARPGARRRRDVRSVRGAHG